MLVWRWLYRGLLRPTGLVKPDVIADHPEPHRFAMLVGGVLAVLSAILLVAGFPVAGWIAT